MVGELFGFAYSRGNSARHSPTENPQIAERLFKNMLI
jgi:hypothetical protein